MSKRRALIIFTREPEAGKTKTRMMPRFTAEECAELHTCFLKDIEKEVSGVNADLWICYTSTSADERREEAVDRALECPTLSNIFEHAEGFFRQDGANLGLRMYNAMELLLEKGYESVALMGTDIPEIRVSSIDKIFSLAEQNDVAIGPTDDGGYHLIAFRKATMAPFEVKSYGNSTVLENTIKSIEDAGLSVGIGDSYQDMDEPEDIRGLLDRYRKAGIAAHKATGRFIVDKLKISIIIPIYNEITTINSIQAQLEAYKNQAEIIFVDGGSCDETCERIGDGFRLICSEKGRAKQMNEGAKASSGDVLFFLHSDSLLPEDILGQIRAVMTTAPYGCFGVKFPSSNILMFTNRVMSNIRAFNRGIPFSDQGIFIDRELFFEMGMFPELPVHEDYQFSLTLRDNGYMPGRTKERITTSIRRYGKGTIGIGLTEFKMWNLRRRYRRGEDVEKLASEYRDIR